MVTIRSVAADEWGVVGWLWQLFRYDLAIVTDAYPYRDGRYQAQALHSLPSEHSAGYMAWSAHPKTGEEAPVAFALVDGLTAQQRSIAGFWVVPQLRRSGIGRRLALEALSRHQAPWLVGFQHENEAAGAFWRSVADEAFGKGRWSETRSPVPSRPDIPDDHLIRSPA